MTPIPGHVIRPGLGTSLLDHAQRVIAVSATADAVWLIPLPRRKTSDGPAPRHMLGPQRYELSAVCDALDRDELVMEDVALPGVWQMKDSDYLASAPNAHQRELRKRRLEKRDFRWNVIQKIVGASLAQDLAPVPHVLAEAIEAQAKAFGLSKPTIYSWLHRFWAGRECINSLLPDTSQCGNPGVRKALSTRRLGRKSRLYKACKIESEGYVLKEGDPERLAMGYSLVKPGVTVRDAYLLTMGAYWSTSWVDERGCIHYELLAPHLRPTQVQFEYWGRALYGTPLRRKLLGADHWSTSTLELAGSAQDQVHAVGQIAMIDSTSSDLYLTSVMSRLKVLPPIPRTVVLDVRSTCAIGFYLGWEPPGSSTSLQAMLCAASDKREIAAKYGIDLAPGEWPGMLHRLYVADNGEMKSEALQEAERQFRFGVEYVKAYSGQSKNLVESFHHVLHKSLDHKIEGTTYGRQRRRGEPAPRENALWNYPEYMHEFIQALIDYNNEMVPELAPAAMRVMGIPPTRINIFRWLRDNGLRADLSCDLGQLRAFCLPNHKAVIRRDGVHLLMEDGIRQLPGHRFFSDVLTGQNSWQVAARKNRGVKVSVKVDDTTLRQIWLPTDGGLIAIPNVQAEQSLLEGLTLMDAVRATEDDDIQSDLDRSIRDQHGLETLARRRTISQRAEKEKRREQSQIPGSRTKRPQKQSLRRNRTEEMAHLNQSRLPTQVDKESPKSQVASQEMAEAANLAMDNFHGDASQ